MGIEMSSFYYRFLSQLSELDFNDESCQHHLANSSLDDELIKIIDGTKQVRQLESLLSCMKEIPKDLFAKALQNLQEQQDKILYFYEGLFEDKEFIGSDKAYNNPDVIIILGCNKTILDLRVKCAIPYFRAHPDSYAILSGGGFSATETESDYMLTLLEREDIKNKVIQEKVSMDTLGNALFTKLLLKNRNILRPNLKILLVTSSFHAPRAIHYFNTVYNNSESFEIAVKGVKTTDHDLKKLMIHELSTEYQAESTLGIFTGNKKDPVDDTAILVRLFQNHGLYKNRYDILREFLHITA
ncbi:YdcF family protein [Candidatus Haliotispira prima]|uniref:YdcF family protein n=1 Tax=Candidatus Haliotispira prima TaxID=3034016 RepID=A0ABY8MGB8_9SPIO|nr:YdcF family protein [Candidatus Haliotispira prima]